MEKRLHLPPERIDRARALAARIVAPVQEFIEAHTTVTVERATLRLAGADGADADGVPVPNLVVDQLRDRLEEGALKYWVNALLRTGEGVAELNRRVADGLRVADLPLADPFALEGKAAELVSACTMRVRGNRARREERLARYAGKNHAPLLYVIVATGQHPRGRQAGARRGRAGGRRRRRDPDDRAVAPRLRPLRRDDRGLRRHLRHAGELPDHAGRARRGRREAGALHPPDELRLGPLHARDRGHGRARAPGHDAERLDVRHPLPRHQHVPHLRRPEVQPHDQRLGGHHHQHRRGQLPHDADAVEKAYTVLASQFLNERFAYAAGLQPWQMGLGHAFEMDPTIKNGFLLELAQAQHGARDLPGAPPEVHAADQVHDRRHLPGASSRTRCSTSSRRGTGQGIHLLGHADRGHPHARS